MNPEYDKGYQSGYDAGYKRAMLDYGLEDDKPCDDVVGVINELVRHKQEMQNDFGWNITLQEALDMAIEELEAEPCEDCVSREAIDEIKELMTDIHGDTVYAVRMSDIRQLPPVTPKQKLCKDCKFFKYDSIAKVCGIPLIVAHEICNKWGDACKTKEDGYCFLFEPKMKGEK